MIASTKILMADSLPSYKTFLRKVLHIFKATSRKHTDVKKLMTRDKIRCLRYHDKRYLFVKFRYCSLCI